MERDEAHRKLEPVTERLERIALALERIADRLDDEAVEEYRGLPHFL